MSTLTPDNKVTPEITPKSSDDVFTALSEGDEDSLDLTTPIKKAEEKKPDEKPKDEKDEDEEEDEESEEEDKEEEEIDELAELEEELEDPTEEDLELVTPVRRREILAKFPELFKTFPSVEKSIYRDREYTKLLPTIQDAKAAVEKAELLENFASDMISEGNLNNTLKLIKDNSPETFARVADNYLEHLAQVDETAYNHVIGNVIKNVVISLVQEAKSSGDDDLRIAAGLLNKHVFGTTKFVPPQNLGKPKSEKKEENSLSEREREFNERQLKTATNEIDNRVKNIIKNGIEKQIDPKGSMTEYVKKTAIRDAIDKIHSLISKDSYFTKLHEKLVANMVKSNFSQESQDKVKRAYLAKANSLLAPVLKSVRNEALRGMGKKPKIDEVIDDVNEDNNGKKPERQRTEPRSSSDKNKTRLDSLKGKTSYEALNELMGDR